MSEYGLDMDINDSAVADLLAREQIREVIYRVARGTDRRDWDLMRSGYHDDGYDEHGALKGQIDEFLEISRPFADKVQATLHHIGNILIELDGDRARAESYTVAYHRFESEDGSGKDDIWGLRYVDRFERRNGEWKIAYRVVAHEWRLVHPVPAGQGRGAVPGYWGRHDEQDPLYWIMDAEPPAAD